jgi:hypothetical protein
MRKAGGMDSVEVRKVVFPRVPATDDRPLIHHPPRAAMCLPREEGSLGAPDVRLQATALLAKTAARPVHPQRRVWKDIDCQRFDTELPVLGVGAIPTTLRPRQAAPGLPRRLGAYWAALQATSPHRLAAPSAMLAHQVAREPLAKNAAVARPDGTASALAWRQAAAEWRGAARLGDLDWSDSAAPPAAVAAEWSAALPSGARCRSRRGKQARTAGGCGTGARRRPRVRCGR